MPLGAAKIAYQGFQAAAAAASWDDWTSSNVGDLREALNDTETRRVHFPLSFANDHFFVVGNQDTNRDNMFVDKIDITSAGVTTWNSRSATETGEAELVFTQTGALNWVGDYDKAAVFVQSGQHYILTYSSGALTWSSEKTLSTTTNLGNFSVFTHPDDPDDVFRVVGNGYLQRLSWDNSTDTFTVVTDKLSSYGYTVRGANAWWTYDGSTYKLAVSFWDNTNTTWKIRHWAADLSTSTDVSLNSTPAPSSPDQARHYGGLYSTKLNEYVHVGSDASGNLVAFSVEYDGSGSSFTQGSTLTLSTPSTYTNLRSVKTTQHVADNTYVVHAQWNNPSDSTERVSYYYFIENDGGTLTELGKVAVSDVGEITNGRGGIELLPNGEILVACEDKGTATDATSVVTSAITKE